MLGNTGKHGYSLTEGPYALCFVHGDDRVHLADSGTLRTICGEWGETRVQVAIGELCAACWGEDMDSAGKVEPG